MSRKSPGVEVVEVELANLPHHSHPRGRAETAKRLGGARRSEEAIRLGKDNSPYAQKFRELDHVYRVLGDRSILMHRELWRMTEDLDGVCKTTTLGEHRLTVVGISIQLKRFAKDLQDLPRFTKRQTIPKARAHMCNDPIEVSCGECNNLGGQGTPCRVCRRVAKPQAIDTPVADVGPQDIKDALQRGAEDARLARIGMGLSTESLPNPPDVPAGAEVPNFRSDDLFEAAHREQVEKAAAFDVIAAEFYTDPTNATPAEVVAKVRRSHYKAQRLDTIYQNVEVVAHQAREIADNLDALGPVKA